MSSKDMIHLSQLLAIQRHVDRTASNVANVDTPGYRGIKQNFREYIKRENEAGDSQTKPSTISMVSAGAEVLDLTGGKIESTGNPTDVAIRGAGWFAIDTPDGQRYTKDGSFVVRADGVLVNRAGLPVAASSGSLRVLKSDGPVSISADGAVVAGSRVLGHLKVVEFQDSRAIRPEGNNLYNAVSEVPRSVQANLAPGFLEKSNVVGAYELINIAQLTRTYENVLKLMLSEASPNELQRLSGQTETS